MKRVVGWLLCLILCFSLTACAGTAANTETPPPPVVPDETPQTPEDTRTLVVYFSMPDNNDNSTVVIDGETLGNTQYMAYVIQECTQAHLFRLVPTVPYPTDHEALVAQAQQEQNEQARPAFAGEIPDFDRYDTVFVGYPNWWADLPMILYTFFDTYDFSGKTIVTFNTHGGSGFSNTNQTIAALEPQAQVIAGLSLSRDEVATAEQTMADWVASLTY